MSQNISSPIPTTITLHKLSRMLEVEFDNGEHFFLPCAYLRAYSTSAEMRQEIPVITEEVISNPVNILAIEPVGNYAIKPIFSDGHRTGIYSWSTLFQLGKNLKKNWVEAEEK